MAYLVIAAVAAVFFVVCYIMVCGLPAGLFRKEAGLRRKRRSEEERAVSVRTEPVRQDVPGEEAPKKPASLMSDATMVIPVKPAAAQYDDEKTRIFAKESFTEARPSRMGRAPAKEDNPFAAEPDPVVVADDLSDPEVLEKYFVRHFLNQYGAVSKTVEHDARTVTHRAVEKLNIANGREACDVLSHIMVQEALQNAQRTYVMMPRATVLEMVTDAFCDVARGGRGDTKTILAYDALKAMPRMEENQFRALSLLLLFHYSRNTDNVDARALQAYAARYVDPFLSALPDEYSGYQQLEYIHCISLNNKDASFGQVLRDSYPLIFAFRGCMKTELEGIMPDWPEGSVVPSLFNSYYKAAVIDDSLLPSYFEEIGLRDGRKQEMVTALLHSRPVVYDRMETAHILEKVSPALAKVQKLWDNSLLRRSALTLMGMYIAQLYIKESIGEEFDLSHWM